MPTLYCPECGYNLTGLKENRCPECGEGYAPGVLERELRQCTPVRTLIGRLFLVPVGISVPCMSVFIIVGTYHDYAIGPMIFCLMALMLLAPFFHGLNTAIKMNASMQTRKGRSGTPWHIREIWPSWIAFAVLEFVLLFILVLGTFFVLGMFGWW